MPSGKFKPKKKSRRPHLLPHLLFLGLLRRPGNAADAIHRAYVLFCWRQCHKKRGCRSVIKALILNSLQVVKEIRVWSRRLGTAAAAYGKSPWRQCLEQLYLAFFFSIDSKNYYLQEFYRIGGMQRARHFVNKGALKNGVYRLLGFYGRHLHRGAETCSLGRKIEFSSYCLRKGLNIVPVLMQFMADGTVKDFRQDLSDSGKLPQEDLFCKPNVDNEGKGAEVWLWKGEQGYVGPGGETLAAEELKERLTSLARRHFSRSYLIQPLVLPHPELAIFRKQATPTVRIITYTAPDGESQAGWAMLRFSRDPTAIVDNASAGGMVAPIDLSTGVLGAATDFSLKLISKRWRQFSDSEIPIQGRPIPYWKESIDLVLWAHELFPHRLVIGWDVIITENGPLLLEGNSQPGLCFIQKAHLEALGQTDLGAAIAVHCRKALDFLYSGIIGYDDSGEAIDLFNGSQLLRRLSWLFIDNKKVVRLVISGKVQRVFYRKWLQKEARKQRLSGWVRNRFDGDVEAVLKGRAVAVEDAVQLAWLGPNRARVDRVKVNWYKEAVGRGFKILSTIVPGKQQKNGKS